MAQVRFEHVGKIYADGTVAVKELTLEIPDGELMVLVGPSGCGKTTALAWSQASRRCRPAPFGSATRS